MIPDTQAVLNGMRNAFAKPIQQVAALCLRTTNHGRDVLLITSSEGRWILPKGWPMDGKSDAQAAEQEAWEEAGVVAATVSAEPVSRVVTTKQTRSGKVTPCLLDLYQIDVDHLSETFPERNKRKRQWVPLSIASKVIDDPALKNYFTAI